MKEAILNRRWLLIIGGYLLAMVAWILTAAVAVRNQDRPVPVVPIVQK